MGWLKKALGKSVASHLIGDPAGGLLDGLDRASSKKKGRRVDTSKSSFRIQDGKVSATDYVKPDAADRVRSVNEQRTYDLAMEDLAKKYPTLNPTFLDNLASYRSELY